jgi:hypothetical protein
MTILEIMLLYFINQLRLKPIDFHCNLIIRPMAMKVDILWFSSATSREFDEGF